MRVFAGCCISYFLHAQPRFQHHIAAIVGVRHKIRTHTKRNRTTQIYTLSRMQIHCIRPGRFADSVVANVLQYILCEVGTPRTKAIRNAQRTARIRVTVHALSRASTSRAVRCVSVCVYFEKKKHIFLIASQSNNETDPHRKLNVHIAKHMFRIVDGFLSRPRFCYLDMLLGSCSMCANVCIFCITEPTINYYSELSRFRGNLF